MSEKKLYRLANDQVRLRVILAIKDAPEGWIVQLRPPTRSLEQNAKFHAICEDIAKSGKEWGGKARTPEQWKAIIVSGHSEATKVENELVLGIEGELINLRESTAQMSKARGSSLIEYALAFCAMEGINTA